MRILVVGGGAAGFMAGITAAEQSPDNEVVIVPKKFAYLVKSPCFRRRTLQCHQSTD